MPHKHEPIICPNCGYHATDNYCAQCGQETHLHNDSFWGLIMHFIGHYFHYDSKFWSTMKMLWFSPGKLTIAYKEKKRMRYIPPVSLYIFISVVFFLAFSLMFNYQLGKNNSARRVAGSEAIKLGKKLNAAGEKLEHADIQSAINEQGRALRVLNSKIPSREDSIEIKKRLAIINKLEISDTSDNKDAFHISVNSENKDSIEIKGKEEPLEKLLHFVPKMFFFMIPIMGLVLLLLFARRKSTNYTDHIIFALHYHTFWFSFMLLVVLLSGIHFNIILAMCLIFFVPALYMVINLRNVYAIGWGRATLYSFVIGLAYLILFVLVLCGIYSLKEKCGISLY